MGAEEYEWARVDPAVRQRINWIEVADEPGLCTRPGRVHYGGNSGYQAIGLAAHCGAQRIILLGFDMQRTGGRAHHYGEHAGELPGLGPLNEWAERMRPLAADLREAGVRVVNATRETAITAFPREELRAALGREAFHIRGMQGLGDNIYQRAVLRELTADYDVWVETAWPQLYRDLPIRCLPAQTKLRTQRRNLARVNGWAIAPRNARVLQLSYVAAPGTILKALGDELGIEPETLTFDLPAFAPDRERPPYVVIRPATLRREWYATSRNPLPEYLAEAARRLRRDWHVVSVADLAEGEEELVEPAPEADETLHKGELHVEQLLALVANARAVVGGVGWLVPAALAYRVPMLCIFGGWGEHHGPERILDPRLDTRGIEQLLPDRFCLCTGRDHDCDKRISDFAARLEQWALGLVQGALPRAPKRHPRQRPRVAAESRHRPLPGDGEPL